MTNWRLVSDLDAYLSKNQVWLAASGKASYKGDVVKNINTPSYQEVHIDDNAFELKVTDWLEIWIKSSQFPRPEEWYKVMNLVNPAEGVGRIITQVDNSKGVFSDVAFEAAFSDNEKGLVKFVAEGMTEYEDYFDEMIRRMNCQIYKKTKKWIPGHRYDSEQETYYYLGEFKSRRKEEHNSGFTTLALDMPSVHLVTKKLGNFKTIKDFLTGSVFGPEPHNIQVLKATTSMVDSGEAIDPSGMPDNIGDLWPEMIQNACNVYSAPLQGYITPKYIFDILAYQTEGKEDYSLSVTPEIKNLLRDVVKKNLFALLIQFWDLDSIRETLKIGASMSAKDNASHLVNLYFSRIEDGNALRHIYYIELFRQLNIDLTDIAKECLDEFDSGYLIMSDFDQYVKYNELYFMYRDQKGCTKNSTQRVKSTNYKIKTVTIEEACGGNNSLSRTLVDIVNEASQTYGIGISKFNINNVGTKRNPMEFVSAEITLDNIVNHFDGNVPDELQREIMNQRFKKLIVEFDKDEIVK